MPVPSIDTSDLDRLLGYNARRGSLAMIAPFLEGMAPFGLRPVDFSVLTLIAHNPGITSRQLCSALGILAPNLVGLVKALEQRELVEKRPHPGDRRAQGLHATDKGQTLQASAQRAVEQLDHDAAAALTPLERQTLIRLLRKLYTALQESPQA